MDTDTYVADLFHALRLSARGVAADPTETNIAIVESQSAALAKLLEQTLDLLDDPDVAESKTGEHLIRFWRHILGVPDTMQMTVEQALVGMSAAMTAAYAIVWALGYSNDREEIYDEATRIASIIIGYCDEILGTAGALAEAPKRPPRGSKPQLVTKSP